MTADNLIRAIRRNCGREGISNDELRQFGSVDSNDYGPTSPPRNMTRDANDADDDGWLRQEPDR